MSVPKEYYDRYSHIQHTGRRKHAGQEVNRMSVLSESRQRQITQRAHCSELRITFAAASAMFDESVKNTMEALERQYHRCCYVGQRRRGRKAQPTACIRNVLQ